MTREVGGSADLRFMRQAIDEALAAEADGDVPVGAVIVRAGAVLARGRNRREGRRDATAHAEVEVVRAASSALAVHGLSETTLYVTLEPCVMCAGALVNARVERVVYGCRDPKAGAIDTLFAVGRDPRLNHRFDVRGGVLEDETREILRAFFARRR